MVRLVIAPPSNAWNKVSSLMAQNSLRLVEDNSLDKNKALDAALSQIEVFTRSTCRLAPAAD